MISHAAISGVALRKLIRRGAVLYGGHKKLKIYGLLRCRSGKRMKTANRIFFCSEKEATDKGFRPCGHCMKSAYEKWKNDASIRA